MKNKWIEIGGSIGSVALFIALLILVNSLGLSPFGYVVVLLVFAFIMGGLGFWLANKGVS